MCTQWNITQLSEGMHLSQSNKMDETGAYNIIQNEVSQKEKYQYNMLTHIYGIQKDGNNNPYMQGSKRDTDVKDSKKEKKKTDFWTMWDKARVGSFEGTTLKHVYYHM